MVVGIGALAEVRTIPALLMAVIALAAPPASAQEAVPIITPTMPNYVGFGLGVTPDYIGADTFDASLREP